MPKNLSLFNCKYNVSSSITPIPKIFVIKVVILPGGGRYFKNVWVGMCHWDPGTLSLY